MTQPIVRYDGGYITCYPGSNQTDNGKLNLEHNMARIVTRLSSKNFCIIKPSFQLALSINQETSLPQIEVGVGECSINGMDLVMTQKLYIDPPTEVGTWHLAFKLARDSSNNVLGDLIYGVSTTFEGVYLTYYDNKPDPVPADMFYLGSVNWDGTKLSNIKEDEDKYGRLWAEDILSKITDPKHPDIRRLTVQELITNLPDWYFSKEGDTVYGPIIVADDRENNKPGIIINTNNDGSYITVKHPQKANENLLFFGDVNQDGVIDDKDLEVIKQIIDGKITPTTSQKDIADVNHDGKIDDKDLEYISNFIKGEGNPGDTGNIYYIKDNDLDINIISDENKSGFELLKAKIYEELADSILHIHNQCDICIDAEGKLKLEGDKEISLSTENTNSPKLILTDDNISITDPSCPDLSFNFNIEEDKSKFTIGKAIWQYDDTTQFVSLLQDNVNRLDIYPESDFRSNLRVQDTLYLGRQTVYGREQTFLKSDNWKLSELSEKPENYINFRPNYISLINPTGNNKSYINISNAQNTKYTKLYDSGSIELQNATDDLPSITFKDANGANTVSIEKVKNTNKLNITGNVNIVENLVVEGTSSGNGLITTNGVVTFQNGTNDASITKLPNENTLYTSGTLKVGSSGSSDLYAGDTIINGKFYVGAANKDEAELTIDNMGNLNTSGTITGAKVYNAVYNDTVEFMEKENYDEIIEPGDVVYFTNSGKVTKYNDNINIKSLAGVVSSPETYGYALGGDGLADNEKVPIALTGRVYLKVDSQLEVCTGDYLGVNEQGIVKVTQQLDRYTLGKATKPSSNGKVYIKVV